MLHHQKMAVQHTKTWIGHQDKDNHQITRCHHSRDHQVKEDQVDQEVQEVQEDQDRKLICKEDHQIKWEDLQTKWAGHQEEWDLHHKVCHQVV